LRGFAHGSEEAMPRCHSETACDVNSLMDLESLYTKDVIALWMRYAEGADRYCLDSNDLFLAISSIDLLQQLVYETVAMSFVTEFLARSHLEWVSWRKNFFGHVVAIEPEMKLKEFLHDAKKSMQHVSVANGRDLKLMHMAERIYNEASKCKCIKCYRCKYCGENDCFCRKGCCQDYLPTVCRKGQALLQTDFEEWSMSKVAWPTPEFDLLLLISSVGLCEGLNQNAGTSYMYHSKYKVGLHVEMQRFWIAAPSIIAKMPTLAGRVNMHEASTAVAHVVCLCPECPFGRPCARSELGEGHPFFVGRCPMCVNKPEPCRDRCERCCHARERCRSCEKRRSKKPTGCPSNGELRGLVGKGCSGIQCRCPVHVECHCMKCKLMSQMTELMRPCRGIRVLAMDKYDPPSDVSSENHCSEPESIAALDKLTRTLQWLVKEAKRLHVICPQHGKWIISSAELDSCFECRVVKQRKESWLLFKDGKNACMHTAAASLCPVCVREVYGISSVHKNAKMLCVHCRDVVHVLVHEVLGGRIIADIELDSSASVYVPAPEPHTNKLTPEERSLKDQECIEEYLQYDSSTGSCKLPVTDDTKTGLARFRRNFSRTSCLVSGPDLLERGVDTQTGLVMRSENASLYKMEKGTQVITRGMDKLMVLGAACIEAAQRATLVSLSSVTPNVLKRKFNE